MRTFWNTQNGLRAIEEWTPNCWVQITCPDEDDTEFLEKTLGIPEYFLGDIADTDERPRYDRDEGWVLIILRIPYVKEVRSRTPYTTIPLGILMKDDICITVCNFETNMMIDFVTSIRGNETLLSKLKFKLKVDELDADLIEDVNIEFAQARETAGIYTNILDSTMDTYANLINNNMSQVMKMLTSISIIMMFPTLMASLFGMNLINGMEKAWWGFPVAIVLTIIITLLFWWFFRHKKWI